MSGYTRQQSFTGGDTILAEHSNDEFDLLEEAFSTTLGHKHDGTAAEGPTIDLLSDNDNDTKIEVEATTDEDIIRFTTANVERARIDTSGNLLIGANPVWHSGNDGATSGLDADLLDGQEGAYYLPAASYTAADVLAKLITVDGAGSNLDADLLDGQSSVYYLTGTNISAATDLARGTVELATNAETITGTDATRAVTPASLTARYTAADVLAKLITVDGAGSLLDADLLDGQQGSFYLPAATYTAADILTKIKTVDGATSGLDSDLLDGQEGAFYTNATNLNAGTVPTARLTAATTLVPGVVQLNDTTSSTSVVLAGTANSVKQANDNANTRLLATSYTAADVLSKLITVDGAGSALDADLLDGVQGASYARSDVADTISGLHTHTAIPAFNGGTSGVSAPFTVDSTQIVTNLNAELLNGQPGSYYEAVVVDASTTAKGIVELATDAETITGTDTLRAITPSNLSAAYTASDVLAKLLTVDGAASGLDADLLDGSEGALYAKLESPALTGIPTTPTAAPGTNNTQVASTAYVDSAESGLASVQTFSATGTWTRPAGVTKVIVELVGGGSSGQGATTTGPVTTNGGAAGGYAKGFIDVSALASETVTVGAGGVGVTTNNVRNAGGSSSFGTAVVATGGSGGIFTPPLPGVGTSGDILGSGFYTENDTGRGGDSFWRRGGIQPDSEGVGESGSLGSGGGAALVEDTTNYAGGSGGDGYVVVWEYF